MTKIFSAIFGLIGYSVTFLIRFMPGMLEAAMVIGGVINGPIIGVFSVGMLLPWVNSKGALAGFIGSITITTWIATGGTVYKHYTPFNSLTAPPYPSNISGCPPDWVADHNQTTIADPSHLAGHIALYDTSYIWYSSIGLGLTVILSLIMTIFTSQDISRLDKKLLSPCLARMVSCLPCWCGRRLQVWWEAIGESVKENGLHKNDVCSTTKM